MKILVGDLELDKGANAVDDTNLVLVTLVRHNGDGHVVEGSSWRAHEDTLAGVLATDATEVAEALNHTVDLLACEDDIVKELLGDLAGA